MIASLLLTAAPLVAAWAYGATEAWALRWVQGLVFFGVVALLPELRVRRMSGDPEDTARLFDWRWVAPLCALLAFMAVSALNASHVYSPGDEGLWPRPHLPYLPRSVSRAVTMESMGRLLTFAGVMAGCRAAFRSRTRRFVFLGAMLLGGLCMAVLTIMQRYVNPDPPRVMTGMFVNENNYAAYANLLLPVALWLGRGFQLRAAARMDRSHPGHLLYLIAAVLTMSVVVSGSRSGMLVTGGIFLFWAADDLVRRRRHGEPAPFRGALTLLAPLIGAASLFVVFSAGRLADDILDMQGAMSAVDGRLAVVEGTVRVIRDRWVAGTGAGTFAAVFPYYQPRRIVGLYFRYAHNDWLQYAAELGAIGTLLLGALVTGALRPAFRSAGKRLRGGAADGGGAREARRRRSILNGFERRGLLVGLAGVALHATIDFPVHIPGVAVLAAAWAGLAGVLDPPARGHVD